MSTCFNSLNSVSVDSFLFEDDFGKKKNHRRFSLHLDPDKPEKPESFLPFAGFGFEAHDNSRLSAEILLYGLNRELTIWS